MLVLAATSGMVAVAVAIAQNNPDVAQVEVRVWQDVEDLRDIRISARSAGGSWRALGTIPLPLDDGASSSGRYEYGDIAVGVPLPNYTLAARVEVRIWQDTRNRERVFISARPAGGSWAMLGTIPLSLDDGLSSSRRFRYGDIALAVPLPDLGVTTLAGQAGIEGYRDGLSSQAVFGYKHLPLNSCFGGSEPYLGLEFHHDGSVVVADQRNNAIRRIAPDGTVTTIAGGEWGEEAQFNGPTDVAVATDGSIYVADREAHRIQKISPDGTVSTVAGTGTSYLGGDGAFMDGPALEATLSSPTYIALDDESGDLYIAERNWHIRRLSAAGWVSTFAGASPYVGGDLALRLDLKAIDVGEDGRVYLLGPSDIRVFTQDGEATTLFQDEEPGLGGALADSSGLAVGSDGTVYVASTCHHQILVLTPGGELRALAGSGERGYADGPAGDARFDHPGQLALSDGGALVVADEGNNVIRILEADPAGTGGLRVARGAVPPELSGIAQSTVLAGQDGRYAYGFEDGPGDEARFRNPRGMAFDRSGNVIVADSGNNAIRSIAPDGVVTTLAGGSGRGAIDGSCAEAQFDGPFGVAVRANGDIYVADRHNSRIRRITRDRQTCQVATAAGGEQGYRDGPAAVARFDWPQGLAFDGAGNLLIVDSGGHRARRFSLSDGSVSTVAGKDIREPFLWLEAIATDGDGNVYVTQRNAIFRVDRAGDVSTVLETAPYGKNAGMLDAPLGIAVTEEGTLYVTEAKFGRLLRITSGRVVAIVVNTESGRFNPGGILIAPSGDVLVSDTENNVIRVITLP
ncbi:MAG: hypothetical protein OXE43_15470 [Chloroflexi bacterium]|nr:hypothetical protein [Chloroflexota bacterium]